jgi:Zn-dependent protease with chaperone function
LEEIFLHERGHVENDDDFQRALYRLLITTGSETAATIIEQKIYPLMHAQELNADLFAALHSKNKGKYLQKFLTQRAADEIDLEHPDPEKRVALIDEVQAELYTAEQVRDSLSRTYPCKPYSTAYLLKRYDSPF